MGGPGLFMVACELWRSGHLLAPNMADSSLGCAEGWLLSRSLSQPHADAQNHQTSCS